MVLDMENISYSRLLATMELLVEGVAIPTVTTLGLVGNILSIIVLHSPGIDMKVRYIYQ